MLFLTRHCVTVRAAHFNASPDDLSRNSSLLWSSCECPQLLESSNLKVGRISREELAFSVQNADCNNDFCLFVFCFLLLFVVFFFFSQKPPYLSLTFTEFLLSLYFTKDRSSMHVQSVNISLIFDQIVFLPLRKIHCNTYFFFA